MWRICRSWVERAQAIQKCKPRFNLYHSGFVGFKRRINTYMYCSFVKMQMHLFVHYDVDHYLWNKMCSAWCLHRSWNWPRWRGHSWNKNLLRSGGICTVVLSSTGIWPRNSWRGFYLLLTLLLVHVGHYFHKWNPWCLSEPFSGTCVLKTFFFSCQLLSTYLCKSLLLALFYRKRIIYI